MIKLNFLFKKLLIYKINHYDNSNIIFSIKKVYHEDCKVTVLSFQFLSKFIIFEYFNNLKLFNENVLNEFVKSVKDNENSEKLIDIFSQKTNIDSVYKNRHTVKEVSELNKLLNKK